MSSFLVCHWRLLHSRCCPLKTQGNYVLARKGLRRGPPRPIQHVPLTCFPSRDLPASLCVTSASLIKRRTPHPLPFYVSPLKHLLIAASHCSTEPSTGFVWYALHESPAPLWKPLQLVRASFCRKAHRESPAQMTSRWSLRQRSTWEVVFFLFPLFNELSQDLAVWLSSFIALCRLLE